MSLTGPGPTLSNPGHAREAMSRDDAALVRTIRTPSPKSTGSHDGVSRWHRLSRNPGQNNEKLDPSRSRSIQQTAISPDAEVKPDSSRSRVSGDHGQASRQSPRHDEPTGDHQQHQPILQQQRPGQRFALGVHEREERAADAGPEP